jgi:RNA polymerase sigma-70 factor (sigma-E family)
VNDFDSSFAAFVEEAWHRHFGLATLLTRDRLGAEELLQDGLVRMYERWRTVRRMENPHDYLRRTLVNNNVSGWRRRRREFLMREVPDRAYPQPDLPVHTLDLRAALRELSPGQRAVVVLRYYEDLPERAVADVLGCGVGTVKSQHAKALAKLRRCLPPLDCRDEVNR